jgi:hypothetical protein
MLLFLLIVGAAILVFAGIGIVTGGKLLRSGSPGARRGGVALILGGVMIPLFCWLGPPHAVRLRYGNYPIGTYPSNRIRQGMSMDQVTAILGTPHEKTDDGAIARWYYWIDSFSIRWFGVAFGADRRVTDTYGN